MPRIFWTTKRKKNLVKQAKTMTVNQLAKKHLKPVVEIERMLRQLSPDNPLIKQKRKEHHGKKMIVVTVYYPAYADGIRQQYCGSAHALY